MRRIKTDGTLRPYAERGQALLLAVLALAVLLGITGLVIDVGLAHQERASLQKSADAAALAGIYYLPEDPNAAHSAAVNWAGRNGVSEGRYEI